MDIVAINNQVVVMRHAVKQAKVHTIHKLTRLARNLKTKKGSDDQMAKNNRKAERMVKEISTIKELNEDEISKFALTNRYTCTTLTKEMASDLPVLCMTKLAEHKAIVSSVNACRKKFDNWEKELPQLLKMCEIRKLFKLTHQTPGKIRQQSKKKPKPTGLTAGNPESQSSNWNSYQDEGPLDEAYTPNFGKYEPEKYTSEYNRTLLPKRNNSTEGESLTEGNSELQKSRSQTNLVLVKQVGLQAGSSLPAKNYSEDNRKQLHRGSNSSGKNSTDDERESDDIEPHKVYPQTNLILVKQVKTGGPRRAKNYIDNNDTPLHRNNSSSDNSTDEGESDDAEPLKSRTQRNLLLVKQVKTRGPIRADDNHEPSHTSDSLEENSTDDGVDSDDANPQKIPTQTRSFIIKKPKTSAPVHAIARVEKPVVVEKRDGEIEVKRFNLSDIQDVPLPYDEGLTHKIFSSSTNGADDSKKAKTKCKDSFFVRSDDESLSGGDRPSDGSEADDMDADMSKASRPSLESTFVGSLRQERSNIFPAHRRKYITGPTRERQKPHETRFGSQLPSRFSESQAFRRDRGPPYPNNKSMLKPMPNRRERRQQLAHSQEPPALAPTSNKDSLHPSWDAKKKLKLQSQIHQFQGKKIKFDD